MGFSDTFIPHQDNSILWVKNVMLSIHAEVGTSIWQGRQKPEVLGSGNMNYTRGLFKQLVGSLIEWTSLVSEMRKLLLQPGMMCRPVSPHQNRRIIDIAKDIHFNGEE